jgi:hypothetical protein
LAVSKYSENTLEFETIIEKLQYENNNFKLDNISSLVEIKNLKIKTANEQEEIKNFISINLNNEEKNKILEKENSTL